MRWRLAGRAPGGPPLRGGTEQVCGAPGAQGVEQHQGDLEGEEEGEVEEEEVGGEGG